MPDIADRVNSHETRIAVVEGEVGFLKNNLKKKMIKLLRL